MHPQAAAPQFEDLAARAAAARDQQNLPQAIELYGHAVQLKPDWAEGWWYIGLLQYTADSFPPAIEAFNRLLELQPGRVPAMALRGLCEFETGAYDDSLRDLEPAVAKGAANEPRNEQILRYHLAQLLTRAGRFQEAQEQYRVFATKHILDPELLVGLGLTGAKVQSLTKDVPAADRAFYQAVGAAGYALLAGETQEAETFFNQLFTRYPDKANLHLFYGILLFPHSPDLAADQFQSEMTVAPSNADARALLAFTLMVAGRYSEAKPEAELALAQTPGIETAQLALGRSLVETGELPRATDLLKQVLRHDPDNMEAHLGLAEIYSRSGRREEAYRERLVCLQLAK